MQRIISASLFLHPGFLIVDHIHFQYNGFMFGILLWSLLMARNVRHSSGHPVQSALWLLTCDVGPQTREWLPLRSATQFQAYLPLLSRECISQACTTISS